MQGEALWVSGESARHCMALKVITSLCSSSSKQVPWLFSDLGQIKAVRKKGRGHPMTYTVAGTSRLS